MAQAQRESKQQKQPTEAEGGRNGARNVAQKPPPKASSWLSWEETAREAPSHRCPPLPTPCQWPRNPLQNPSWRLFSFRQEMLFNFSLTTLASRKLSAAKEQLTWATGGWESDSSLAWRPHSDMLDGRPLWPGRGWSSKAVLAYKGKAESNMICSIFRDNFRDFPATGRRKSLSYLGGDMEGQWFLTEAPSPTNRTHPVTELGTQQGTCECVPTESYA